MADLTQFDFRSAVRIARVVQAVEQEPRRARPLTFGAVLDQRKDKVFRVATFTGDWDKNSSKTVTFKNQTATPNTVSASNLLFDISGPATSGASTTKVCIVGKEGTAWYFVNAEKESCSGGYAARELSEDSADPDSSAGQLQESSGPQVLLNDAGCVRWFGLEEREVVTDVLWDDGLVVVKKFVWVIGDPRPPVNVTIIESTTCEESP